MLTATPDLVEWNDIELMWDYYGAHPFGYWATLDDREEYKMCYGKEQTTHKEASSRFYAECVNSLLDDFQYERANELEWLLEEYDNNKEDYNEDVATFYYDNYSGDFDDYDAFKQIIKFRQANGGITYGQINEIVDNNKDAYDDIIHNYTGLYSNDFYSLINSDSDFQFSSRKFNDWFYHKTQYNGRIWTEDYIICMYNDENLSPGEMRRIITDLSKTSGIPVMTLMNYTYLRDTSFDSGEDGVLSWTVRGFIHGEEPKVTKDVTGRNDYDSEENESDSTNNDDRPLHLQSPYEKWRALKDFRRNRDKVWGQKLTKSDGDEMTMAQYHNLIRQENKNRNTMRKVRLTESDLHRIVNNSVRRIISEMNLGGGQIDFSDWHITDISENPDGYYDFEARCDNNWYTLRGTYANGEIELDFLMRGHSGYGRQIPISDELERWFDIYGREQLTNEIERRIDDGIVRQPDYDDEW